MCRKMGQTVKSKSCSSKATKGSNTFRDEVTLQSVDSGKQGGGKEREYRPEHGRRMASHDMSVIKILTQHVHMRNITPAHITT